MRSTRWLRCLALAVLASGAIVACSSSSTSTGSTAPGSIIPNTTSPDTASPDTSGPDTSGPDTTAGGFSVLALLDQVPTAVVRPGSQDGPIDIVVGDLDAATTLEGAERPAPGPAGDDDVVTWLNSIDGPHDENPVVAVLLPEAVNLNKIDEPEAFRDELGWTIGDVSSYIEYRNLPAIFTVLTGAFDETALTKTLGPATDGIWSLGGSEDYAVDLFNDTPARPVGEALRMSVDGDRLAVARATPPVAAWIDDNAHANGTTMADEGGFRDVAKALDDAHVYGAELLQTTPGPGAAVGIGPFTVIGVGQSVIDGTPKVTLAYEFTDAATATAGMPRLEDVLADGKSERDGKLWSNKITIDKISTEGNVLVATLGLTDDFVPGSVWGIIATNDILAVSSR